jgi:hypothetical protein
MAISRGRNNGVSGLVDIPGVSPASPFVANILGWNLNNGISSKPRVGRGSGRWPKTRYVLSSGKLVLTGELRFDAPPLPTAWQNHEGTVTIQLDQKDQTIKKVAVPIRITGAGFSKNEKKEDTWNISLAADVTGECTFAGFGTVPAGTVPTAANQEQYAGTSKTYDANGLATSAVRTIDIWGTLGDTDAAEVSLLSTSIGAALAPITNTKVRFATFSRDSIDGGTLVIHFGLNDTLDDQQLPQDRITVDANMLQSSKGYGAVFTYGGTEPTAPTPPTGEKIVNYTDVRLNPTKSLRVWTMAPSDSADSVELPNNKSTVDTHGLASASGYAKVYTTGGTAPTAPTPPTGQKIITYADVPLNPIRTVRVWTMGPSDTADNVIQGATSADYSQNGSVSRPASIVNLTTGQTLKDVVKASWDTYQASANFAGASGRLITPTKAVVVQHWDYNNFRITAEFREDTTPYWTAGGKVNVAQAIAISDTMSWVILQPGTTGRIRASLRIMKQVTTDGFTDDLVKYSTIGKVNSAAWLNFAIGTLMYKGSDPSYQGDIADSHVSRVSFLFEFDSLGFPNEAQVVKTPFITDADVDSGDVVDASTFSWNVACAAATEAFGTVFGNPA